MVTSLHLYLPSKRLKELMQTLAPLLPLGVSVAVRSGERFLGGAGSNAEQLTEHQPDTRSHPFVLDGQSIGQLLWYTPPECASQTQPWIQHLITLCQSMIALEQARRAVTHEALESLREIALLERASTSLNRSLRPKEVANALLTELASRSPHITWGAVFLYDITDSHYGLLTTLGHNADALFEPFARSTFFQGMIDGQIVGIINDIAAHELCSNHNSLFHSTLSLPLDAHQERVGLLVLAAEHKEAFTSADLKRTTTLASIAATALRNAQLFAAETNMFRAFISMIATAIDAKSPYTAGHCRRVPEIARMLTEAACADTTPLFAGFRFTEDDWETLEIATYLHDCGKVVTPEWVVDKPTKLSTNMDRVELIELRIQLILQQEQLTPQQTGNKGPKFWQEALRFVRACNLGTEMISPESEARLRGLAACCWRDGQGQEHPLLDEEELDNLLIRRGTLNANERAIIEDHVVHTINMLKGIPFPPRLRHVVEYAGGHHECLNGRGYPYHLTETALSIPARVVAIADIFEALTAPDRPYRSPYTLSKTLDIMHRMSREGHIDPDLFQLFLRSGVYQRYAENHLKPHQIDSVDLTVYLGG
ncbi:MAG: HD domain-containing protein [Magnetococcales bacterium]|nr:HD domain-containing protein [Magnetococcales bacterium]NGZ07188.1 HD domain-containing protein [Magnetococcales bacterium]